MISMMITAIILGRYRRIVDNAAVKLVDISFTTIYIY
jgi:hypothetical protein